jgi:hypothetical protein
MSNNANNSHLLWLMESVIVCNWFYFSGRIKASHGTADEGSGFSGFRRQVKSFTKEHRLDKSPVFSGANRMI